MYDKLIKLFLDKNKQINLSAIRDEEGVKIKHIQDSLEGNKVLYKFLPKDKQIDFVDIWTGSWFPLLPLAISNPFWNFLWIESVRKKVDAINDIIVNLNLSNVKVIWTRAEQYKDKQFDILSARAVAYIDKLFKYSKHLVKKGWYFLFYKQFNLQEYNDLKKLLKKYNYNLIYEHHYKLFDTDIDRVIYLIRK